MMTVTTEQYQEIFDLVPLSLWIGDFADMFDAIEPLRQIPNLREHLKEHPELVWELASKVKILKVNQHALRTFDVATPDDLFASLNSIFIEETLPVFEEQMLRWAEGETWFQGESAAQTAAGRQIHLMVSVNLIGPPGARPRIGLACHVDLTARKHLEHELYRSNQELEQFAYVASHDLQEPLRMVASYSELLAKRYEDQLDDRARKYISYAVDGAKRMKSLISGLLAYSRISSQPPQHRPVDLNALLKELLTMLEILRAESNATITYDSMPTITGDRMLLTQLMQNLITNAFKFRGTTPPCVHIGAVRRGQMWQISVKDNGIGIPENYQDSIFAIFKRVYSREDYPGTGIGLAIAKRIVEQHHGQIWVESEVDVGTTFYFTVPALS